MGRDVGAYDDEREVKAVVVWCGVVFVAQKECMQSVEMGADLGKLVGLGDDMLAVVLDGDSKGFWVSARGGGLG